ncbi:MAG: Holliday junction branch migration protein RuvA [Rickettsiales bacterium]
MIGKLRGKVDSIAEDHLILDVNGVGYLVFASSRILSQLADIKGEVSLAIETHVREDHIHLYGFLTEAERAWFKLLTTVQGVGAKMGLSLLSAFSPEEMTIMIAAGDVTSLTRANGVGKKLGERLVTELKSKVGALEIKTATFTPNAAPTKASKKTSSLNEDAVSALIHLGYSRTEAFQAVARAVSEGAKTLDDIIKMGLQELVA